MTTPTPPKPKSKGRSASPTKRSREHLEADGWIVDVVEHWNPFAKIRKDLFGFGDLFAVKPGHPPTIVQTTSLHNFASRRTKILASEKAAACLAGGVAIVVHGWDDDVKPPRLRAETIEARLL